MPADSTWPRLYMAFYPRQPQYEDDVKYHTGLLYVPKPPDKGNRKESVRYHLKIVKKDGKEVWEFDAKGVHCRTNLLVSVTLLGKVNISEDRLRKKLAEIKLRQGQKDWRCHHWTWTAIKTLADARDIDAQPLAPEQLWNKQVEYTDQHKADSSKPLLAIDKTGKAINASL